MSMDFTERLINLVRQHPCLYDSRLREYKNTAKKDMLWEVIGKELKQNSDLIRTKWKNLKDGYAKYKKSFSGKCPKMAKYRNWMWGPYLSFLDGAVMLRPKNNELLPDASNNTELLSSCKSEENSGDGEGSNANDSSIHDIIQLSSSRISRKRRGSNHDDEYHLEDRVTFNEPKDSIDLLFESYAKALKQLKPRTQAAIKIKLARIFADAELEELQSNGETEVPIQNNVYSVLSTMDSNDTYPGESSYDEVKKE